MIIRCQFHVYHTLLDYQYSPTRNLIIMNLNGICIHNCIPGKIWCFYQLFTLKSSYIHIEKVGEPEDKAICGLYSKGEESMS